MQVLNIGKLPDQQSMLIFHALARMGYEGLVVVSPKNPLASVGYFQESIFCNYYGIPLLFQK